MIAYQGILGEVMSQLLFNIILHRLVVIKELDQIIEILLAIVI